MWMRKSYWADLGLLKEGMAGIREGSASRRYKIIAVAPHSKCLMP